LEQLVVCRCIAVLLPIALLLLLRHLFRQLIALSLLLLRQPLRHLLQTNPTRLTVKLRRHSKINLLLLLHCQLGAVAAKHQIAFRAHIPWEWGCA
jgi:hypothetical protein